MAAAVRARDGAAKVRSSAGAGGTTHHKVAVAAQRELLSAAVAAHAASGGDPWTFSMDLTLPVAVCTRLHVVCMTTAWCVYRITSVFNLLLRARACGCEYYIWPP